MSRNKTFSSPNNPQARQTQISKSLSLLLRHRAQQEGIPMSPAGFCNVADVLSWHRLRSAKVGLEEMVGVVETDRRVGKARFGLRYLGGRPNDQGEKEGNQSTEKAEENDTESAIESVLSEKDLEPKNYEIRATQGHSLKVEDMESLLTPITLDDSTTIPDVVVHGTFCGAWEGILSTGGLKVMGRQFVHLATGPALREVIPEKEGEEDGERDGDVEGKVERSLVENKVRSGMRSDAQILIYVDIRRALDAGVKFWRSENGVVLTEGKSQDESWEGGKALSTEFFDTVVEIKRGVGVLWRDGNVVKELPEGLRGMGVPRGKGERGHGGGWGGGKRGGRGRGRGMGRENGKGRPGLVVERDELQ